MEKKHSPSYHSDKILGQLYDKVQTVDFVPQWGEPFDRRILRAYKLDDATLKAARQVKSEYDTAMRRIMAQQEINTEFEVWSTFVLSRPRVGSDYKIQETMAVISDGLKEQYRRTCIQRAGCIEGNKEFSKLGPFVAAMYKVTKEELDIALAECRMTKLVAGRPQPKRKMEPKFMPLISFPWLFEKELGRIATGIDAEDDLIGLGLLPLVMKKDGQPRKRQGAGDEDVEDYIEQEDGVIVHRGEELDLFHPDVESVDLSGESDYEEARSLREDGSYIVGESREVATNTPFQAKVTLAHLLSGTGVEDVVPRTELDGFVHPRSTSQFAPELNISHGHHIPGLLDSSKPARSLATSNFPLDTNFLLPATNGSFPARDFPSPSMGNISILDSLIPPLSEAGAEAGIEDVEEEEINLDMEESSLEKLARMMNS